MIFANFFRDKQGRVVVGQAPNWPIWYVAALSVLTPPGTLANFMISPLLAYWGVMELLTGVNGFRKTLGVIGLGYSLWRLVQ